MKGLILKDTWSYLYKQHLLGNLIAYGLNIAVVLFLSEGNGLTIAALLSIPISCSGLPTNLFEMDGKCNFDRYAIALPFTKAEIVKSRFASGLLFVGKGAIEVIVFCLLDAFVHSSFTFHGYLAILIVSICLSVCIMGISLTSNYILGINGGALMMLAVMVISCFGYALLLFLDLDLLQMLQFHPWLLLSAVCIFTLLMYFLTYRISVIYYKRHHA